MATFGGFCSSGVQEVSLHYLNHYFDYSPSERYPRLVPELGEALHNGDDWASWKKANVD